MQMCKKKVFVLSFLLVIGLAQTRRVIRAAPGEETTGNYIVVLRPETNHSRFEAILNEVRNESINSTISEKVEGPFAKIVAAKISEEAAHRVSQLEGVNYVEEETYAHGSDISWAVDRINQINANLDGYSNSQGDGQGVDIYQLDSGINYDHCEFGRRALFPGYDPLDKIEKTNKMGRDCHGHGTHTASIAAGATFGVATKATIYSVRVLGCDNRAPWSIIIDGLNYAGQQIMLKYPHRSALILMPLAGPNSTAMDEVLNAVLSKSIPILAAAGNGRKNACENSPASTNGVITVAASTKQDDAYNNTNGGPCVDIFAPGVQVMGANHSCSSCTCTSIHTGTSVAAALVAGVVALYLQESPTLTPEGIRNKLIENCVKDALSFRHLPVGLISSTSNCLLHIGSITGNDPLPTSVVTETATQSVQPSQVTAPTPTPEAVCCEMLKKFENIEKSLGSIVEKGINRMTDIIQDNITSLIHEVPSPPTDAGKAKSRERVLPPVYIPGRAVQSCQDLLYYSLPSGYYPVNTGGRETMVYCELEKAINNINNRGFARIAHINMSLNHTQCPDGLSLREDKGLRTCQRGQVEAGCSSVFFSTSSIEYTKVCGRVRGYQWASPNAFYTSYRYPASTIDDPFVDGVVLTHRTGNGDRRHIWTFAAASDEIGRSSPFACPCTNRYYNAPVNIPAFVENDYFCETGTRDVYAENTFYGEDPLWDGKGCGEMDTCCERGEWFCKDVPKTSSDIELRLCGNELRSNEDTPLEIIELYVQ